MDKKQNNPLRIDSIQLLDNIPSGSGIVLKNDTHYIIGDDATGMYLLDAGKQQKIPVGTLNFDRYREPKSTKHDFECATLISWQGKEYLLAFGSGSTPARDSLLMINTADFRDGRIISLQKFYNNLKNITQTNIAEWNIEGAASGADSLYLFNRGNNMIISLSVNEWMVYLHDVTSAFPGIDFHAVTLPFLYDHQARLSGGCALDTHHLLFSASVEDTPDWYTDGPVLGSYIGIYSLRDNTITDAWLLQDELGTTLKEKLESVCVVQNEPGQDLVLLAVGDNDNGTTNLFRLTLDKSVLEKLHPTP